MGARYALAAADWVHLAQVRFCGALISALGRLAGLPCRRLAARQGVLVAEEEFDSEIRRKKSAGGV
jgi:hypothetical protein